MPLLEWLESTSMSHWIRESSSLWAYPAIITAHSIGLAIMVGLSAVIALRILGVASGLSLASMARLYPTIWTGFLLNAVSGVLLIIGEPTVILTNPLLWIKLVLVAASVYVVILTRQRVLDTADARKDIVARGGRRLAVATLVLWSAATTAGRFTAYLGQ